MTPLGRAYATTIFVDIVHKQGNRWNLLGTCPDGVTESGCLHVYRGAGARVQDAETDQVIVSGRSLDGVLQLLADRAGFPVELADEVTPGVPVRRFEPSLLGVAA